jgi:hypothetical protein
MFLSDGGLHYAAADREGQAMRLTGPVVWILAEDHHLRVGVAGQREGSEALVAGRVHVVMSAFISHALKKAAPVRFSSNSGSSCPAQSVSRRTSQFR